VKYGDCTWTEVREYARNGAVAIVPFGCTEQQSTHLPVDFDTWFAEDLAVAAAAVLDARGKPTLVLPVVPFGPTPEHRNFGAGYIDIPAGVHDAVAGAILTSLAEQGFHTVVVWRGCGGHDLRGVVEEVRAKWERRTTFDLPASPFERLWAQLGDPAVSVGHADSFTTSICLYRRPQAVRLDRVPAPSASPDWADPALDFTAYTSAGTIGDARAASAERGEALWRASVEWMVDHVLALCSWERPRRRPSE
jgi:creatinine amidohydrolase/Fe(II)-dependent formamide hydrolase-like protein